MRGALAATAVAAVVGVSAGPAMADPPAPDNLSDAAKQVRDLSHEAERVTEEKKAAEEDHAAKKAELDRATADANKARKAAEKARADEAKFRKQVDELTNASYQGARLNELSAMLASESPGEYLDRAAALDVLAKDNNQALQNLAEATKSAETNEQKAKKSQAQAAKAEGAANRLKTDLEKKTAVMDERVAEAEEQYAALSAEDQDDLTGGGDTDYEDPGSPGDAGGAVSAALAQQGKPYVFGAKGPDSFDCSGLMHYAYQQVGISIGGSTSSQISDGRSISTSELKPGDLIFYNSPVSHVSMYVGNGNAVHAPTTGDVVKVDSYQNIGDVTSARRITG